jgi:hypothetical protein
MVAIGGSSTTRCSCRLDGAHTEPGRTFYGAGPARAAIETSGGSNAEQ